MAVSLMCPTALIRKPCDMTEMGTETEEEVKEERMETRKVEAMTTQMKSKTADEIPVIWSGKSLVAARRVEMGEVLLLEAAVLELPPQMAKVEKEVERRVEMLAKEELQRLVLLQKRFPTCSLHAMLSSPPGWPQWRRCQAGMDVQETLRRSSSLVR